MGSCGDRPQLASTLLPTISSACFMLDIPPLERGEGNRMVHVHKCMIIINVRVIVCISSCAFLCLPVYQIVILIKNKRSIC